jgi:ATP-dependent Clp protease, protease subunit
MLNKIEIDTNIKHRNIKELIDAPIVVRVNKFTEDSAKNFQEDINYAHDTGQPVIPVIIDSYGGACYTLLSMINTIQTSKLPIATICESKAMSAGAILFALGQPGLRYMSEHATLMIHDLSSFIDGKIEELKNDVEQSDKLNAYIFKLLAKHCKKDPNYFLDLIEDKSHMDWFLNPKEAKKHNLCDQIAIPSLITKIKVDYEFK